VKVVIEMYTGASDEPAEVHELSVGDTFDDLSDQWSWFKVAAFTSPGDEAAAKREDS
jgi:hypothetical protein